MPQEEAMDWRHGALAGLLALLLAGSSAAGCPPESSTRDDLRQLKAAKWQVDDDAARDALALSLLPCLASPDPELRDDLALDALTSWMRGGALSVEAARTIGTRMLGQLQTPDADGFAQPFAALALAEVARADRLRALWTPGERDAVVSAAADYERDNRDYRGFDPQQGWRHGVAHGADLLLQLALNPALDRVQLDRMLDAVARQVLPPQPHFYIYGEGERLARPVIFIARRALHSEAEWTAWFGRLALAAAPDRGTPATIESLARLNDAKAFFYPLYAALQEGGDAEMRKRLLPGLTAALRTLP
jgi:hypothetical protein